MCSVIVVKGKLFNVMINIEKCIRKAVSFAHENGIELNNYPVTHIWVNHNDIHMSHVNEYGCEYPVGNLYGVANEVFTHREFTALTWK